MFLHDVSRAAGGLMPLPHHCEHKCIFAYETRGGDHPETLNQGVGFIFMSENFGPKDADEN